MAPTNLVMRERLLSRGLSLLRPGGWRTLAARVLLITAGALVAAISVAAFLVPAKITGPGAIGLATILNHLLGTSVGLVVLLVNIPIMILAYRTLGGIKVILATIYFIIIFSAMVELLVPRLANVIATDNTMLMALFGGIVGGLGVV